MAERTLNSMKPMDKPMSDKSVMPKKKGKGMLPKIIILLVIIALAGSTWYYRKQSMKVAVDPSVAAQKEVQDLIAKVGKLIVLPEGETPTIATVNDPEKLKTQPFFANAKQGFKVLIYTTAKKAILYDPAANIIVEVAPLNIGAPAPAPTAPAENTNQ